MTDRAILAGLVLTAASLAPAAPAAADELRSALGQPLREVSHAVDITIDKGVATYRVRRVFANPGDVADEAGLAIELPFGAAATGLRIRARDRWYDGELMERERAAKLYQELTGRGAFAPKDPALLQWLWADKLYLQVFPVLPGQASTVEYTLTVPTRYQGGRVFLSYPRLASRAPNAGGAAEADADIADADGDGVIPRGGLPLATPVVTVTPRWGDATTAIVVDGVRVTPGAPVVLAAASRPDWYDAVEASDRAGYVASDLIVPDTAAARRPVTAATVTLDIRHTYRSDLRVDLLTPRGARVEVFQGGGGGDNDVRGTFAVKLPAGTPAAGAWRLVVSDHAALDVGTIDAWSLRLGSGPGALTVAAADLPRFIPDAPESANEAGLAMIEVAPPAIDVLAARLGKVVASERHAFARLELDLAPQLRPLPAQARVVFVVDASHSIGPAGIDAQLAIVRAYLAHVPDARAEVVLYRRAATRLFGALIPAGEVAGRLDAARAAGQLAPGNGSALELGAALAAEAPAGVKAGKDGVRVVLTSDELVRRRLAPAAVTAALGALPRDAIVHVVVPELDGDESVALVRDDDAPLAAVAAARRGVLARVTGLPARADKELVRTALGLVRPMQLDRVTITGLAVARPGSGDPLDGGGAASLREGVGLREMVDLPRAPDRVIIAGKIWGDAFRRVVTVDGGFTRATAGWVFSEDHHGPLSEAEQMKVALLGRAVSPVTSYLAIEPGVRPSTIGIPLELRGVGGFGQAGVGFGGGGGSLRVRPDLMALVAPAARACVDRHRPAAGWQVRLEVETTRDEVADVVVGAGASLPVAACLVEAVWATRLDRRFSLDREDHALHFR